MTERSPATRALPSKVEAVIKALGPNPMPQYRALIPGLRQLEQRTINLPYEAIKDWRAVSKVDFMDGAETVTFLLD